jgi:outer membrane receptor protein involved in Fe transport
VDYYINVFMPRTLGIAASLLLYALPAIAQVFGTVRVTARDQQTLAIANAEVTIKASESTWTQSTTTNANGEAIFPAVPVGQYTVAVNAPGFDVTERAIGVVSNAVTPVTLQLKVAGLAQSVVVASDAQTVNPESSRTETLVQRIDILRDPDADRSGSLAMITNNVPGAYMLHDHLHSRGGHGVSWQIDGVPIPSSALAAVGSQFDPKDVGSLEVNRGGLSTNLGDRPYGVFNVVPRSGFEAKRFAEVTGTYGSYELGNLHAAFGEHTDDQKFAYFASGSANRTNRALERVDIPVLHDTGYSFSGFTSMIANRSPNDQLRVVAAARTDRFQVPNVAAQQALGIDDREIGTDSFANVTWLHTWASGSVLTVSPYYHLNRQQYVGGPADPLVTTDRRDSNYVGAYASWTAAVGVHTLRIGTDSFAEHDNSAFGLRETTGSLRAATQQQLLWSHVVAAFVEDSYRATPWLTFNGGVRFEQFDGTLTERALSPRIGSAISVPHLGVVRASYSQYYEHPSTVTLSGPILDFALTEGFGFLPLRGERDKVWEVGVGIPLRGWTLDLDAYRNSVENLADHDVLGNSNLLFPLSIAQGRVRAFETTIRTPSLFKRLQLHSAFAYQIAQARGAVTGGMTDFQPPTSGYFYLDHDQLVTFNSGGSLDLPRGWWISGTVLVGSGFLLGDGPDHLPAHATTDVAVGKALTDNVSLRAAATNVTNKQYLTGFENSFAGTHYGPPREVSVQVRYKFHY